MTISPVDGVCATCGATFKVGDVVSLDRDGKGHHFTCLNLAGDEVEAAAAARHGRDFRLRQDVAVEVIRWSSYECMSLSDFLDELHAIPEDRRASATVEFDDGDFSKFRVTYTRPETDHEMQTRISGALVDARAKVQSARLAERDQYERLKAKFG